MPGRRIRPRPSSAPRRAPSKAHAIRAGPWGAVLVPARSGWRLPRTVLRALDGFDRSIAHGATARPRAPHGRRGLYGGAALRCSLAVGAPMAAEHTVTRRLPPPTEHSPVARPRTWLAVVGWRKDGLVGLEARPKTSWVATGREGVPSGSRPTVLPRLAKPARQTNTRGSTATADRPNRQPINTSAARPLERRVSVVPRWLRQPRHGGRACRERHMLASVPATQEVLGRAPSRNQSVTGGLGASGGAGGRSPSGRARSWRVPCGQAPPR